MPTRNVILTDHQALFIEQLVNTGQYQDLSEVLRASLRLMEQHEAENAAKLNALREAAQSGIAAIEAGRYTAFESAESLGAHLDALAAEAINNA
ncbi:MAG: type II toxin-antitoxin system ParD family antitoxin [Pseudomonadales bacterium]|jgi:antitoxin ParD1/3/4|nr:type II toxin-antitoxin system ParD family antitoxin [Pseudomonadales bacterium]